MPYTPPSRSAASPPSSPRAERRHTEPVLRVTLPRSSSYLTRHRRTPSALGPVKQGNDSSINDLTPPGTSEDLKAMASLDSVRQSPPPVTGPGGMPSGAVISPPDSLSGSDDEGLEMRGRKLPNLKELQDAVSHLSLHRGTSPPSVRPATAALPEVVDLTEGMHHSFSTGALDSLGSRRDSLLPAPRMEPDAIGGGSPFTASEEDSDAERPAKPPMVRKKSGELVRPALRAPSARRRPASMPGTPTFSKAVHFDAHLEHVRHFLQLDRPLAVSAGSSPVENHDSDSEYPFPSSEDENPRSQSPRFEWELQASNFPAEDIARSSLPARVERFWLSKDCKSLQGSVVVANLAFNKNIICRFTLDSWKTTSEVAAAYSGQIHGTNHDRWTFTIRLSDMAHLETKTMYLCVRYNVNGQEYWDNNNGANFKVIFHKKYLPQNGKNGYAGAGARPVGELPRSTRRPNNDTAAPRPNSMPACLISNDPFLARRSKLNSVRGYYDENGPIRLKRHSPNSQSEDFTSGTAPRNQAFGRRYDFNASLHEAKQSAKTDARETTDVNVNKPEKSKPSALQASGNDSPSRKNYTYDEIVNRFCFYGSKQSSAQQSKPGTPGKSGPSKVDGHDEAFGSMSNSDGYHHHKTCPINGNSFLASTPPSDYATADRSSSPSIRPESPASNFSPRAGASPVSVAAHHSQRHNRFPFRPEAHAPTAIHG